MSTSLRRRRFGRSNRGKPLAIIRRTKAASGHCAGLWCGRLKIVLADEPTAALDRKTGREIVELLHQLAKGQGCAILMVTHDNRILDLADRVLTLEDGRITSFVAGLAANTGQLLAAFAKLQRKGDLVRHMGDMSGTQFLAVAGSDDDRIRAVRGIPTR